MCEIKKELQLDNEVIIDTSNKVKSNQIVSELYENLSLEFIDSPRQFKYESIASRIKNCYKYWNCNIYKEQKIIDVKNINLCHSKFCRNCQNQISKLRYQIYTPLIESLSNTNDIYHVVFTIKNPKQNNLKSALNLMYKKFVYIIGYLKGARKVKGIDFTQYGYKGCIRSLEITTKTKNGVFEYHPHFHCIFVLNKNLNLSGKNENAFSYSKANGYRKFTDFEILLQKIWFLACNNIRVNKKNIENLDIGYSVIFDKCNTTKDYKEVFKYTLKEDFGTFINNYEIFKELELALTRKRVLTCYGCFKQYDDKELEEYIDKKTWDLYVETLLKINKLEIPTQEYKDLREIKNLALSKQVSFISKNSIKRYVSEFNEQD